MLSLEIRRKFLQYFKEKGHAIIRSSPVVPEEDPTLLFTNAGMNQFKDVFLGKSFRDYKRAATSQKCIRVGGKHNDLDNVGHTSRHLTFFEMLGNFSFGDYFKKEAILFAWEVATTVFEFPEEKIWPTIFENDDEAFDLWRVLVPEKRIIRFGEKENFWSMGDTGPCGPCSELLFDRGPKYGNASSPKEDLSGERYLEFWNLVFMQFNRGEDKKLQPLPKQSIDTGAGLERIASLKLGVNSVFATDILRALIAEVEVISQKKYDPTHLELAPAYHVIADHIRSLSFAIADGAKPSNVDRGYVLRKLIRRAVRYGKMLGLHEPFLGKLLPRLSALMGEDYPEIKTASTHIEEVLTIEEEGFFRTLKRGGNILSHVIDQAKKSALHEITGEEAFKLKDTYGFPLEEILLIAKDSALTVNLEQYALLEEAAKEISRKAKTTHKELAEESLFKTFLENSKPSLFVGYEISAQETKIEAILQDGSFTHILEEGMEGSLILQKTPFYPEKGGQIYDIGVIEKNGALFEVQECKSPFPGIILHIGIVKKGSFTVQEIVTAKIDLARRKSITAHHTATHLLHFALQEILGSHIRQAGSLVSPEHLRFDFNHHKPITKEELRKIEELVNEKIRSNAPLSIYEIPYEKAQELGEIKQFFGDKYGALVRVVDIDFSKELCGGTHVNSLGMIGLFRILKESSIASGVRRIEAAAGSFAERFMYQQEEIIDSCSELVKAPRSRVVESVLHLKEALKREELEIKALRKELLTQKTAQFLERIEPIDDFFFLGAQVSLPLEEIKLLSDALLELNPRLILVLGAIHENKVHLLVRVSPSLIKAGISAAALLKEIAPLIDGSGGGRENSAQAGGKNPAGIEPALKEAKSLLCGSMKPQALS